jgi:predicted enzyme related to lactoylglutathione lyase
MFKGLRTVVYKVDDIGQAKEWYQKMLGIAPYFDEAFYAGFSVGGYELGLDPDMAGVTRGNNHIAYWGVPNCEDAYASMLEKGAEPHEEPKDVGGGIIVATVKDPFGNIFGIIENPFFKGEE